MADGGASDWEGRSGRAKSSLPGKDIDGHPPLIESFSTWLANAVSETVGKEITDEEGSSFLRKLARLWQSVRTEKRNEYLVRGGCPLHPPLYGETLFVSDECRRLKSEEGIWIGDLGRAEGLALRKGINSRWRRLPKSERGEYRLRCQDLWSTYRKEYDAWSSKRRKDEWVSKNEKHLWMFEPIKVTVPPEKGG
jgi:hypothetical protein